MNYFFRIKTRRRYACASQAQSINRTISFMEAKMLKKANHWH